RPRSYKPKPPDSQRRALYLESECVKLVFIRHALEPSHCVILLSIDTSSFKLLSTHTWHLAVCHGRRPAFPGGFAIEDFQPLHVKRPIENGRRNRVRHLNSPFGFTYAPCQRAI